jgi:FixJ family two-component response regulator
LYAASHLALASVGIDHAGRVKASVIAIVDDDNEVRKLLFTLLESADRCVDAQRCEMRLVAEARIDESSCQVIE